MLFLCAIDEMMWDFVENGYVRPTTVKSKLDKDTELQMLTTQFEEVKMSNDELFDSFYGRLKEIVIAKLNLWEKIEDDKREFKKKDGKDSPSTQGIVCYECNDHGHLKKECPKYFRGKSKVFATTLSDSESSNSDRSEERRVGKEC